MIHIEDADFVRFTLEEGDIAVPFSVVRKKDGDECEITVYESFLGIAEEFVRLHGEAPFTDEAILFLKGYLSKSMCGCGFKPTRDIDTRIRTFKVTAGEEVCVSAIMENTRIVSGADDLSAFRNLTTHAIEMDGDDPDDISAVVIEDGKLVAYATLNDVFDDEEYMEISVECALGYRGRGYASSCAAALAWELCSRGYVVSYKCRHTNAASARVAQKAGFTETSMEYNFVCYREDRSGKE